MDSRFIIYGRTNCSFCIDAVNLLKEKGYNYCFFDFTEDPEAIADAKSFYKWETVPMILKNDTTTGVTNFVGGLDSLKTQLSES